MCIYEDQTEENLNTIFRKHQTMGGGLRLSSMGVNTKNGIEVAYLSEHKFVRTIPNKNKINVLIHEI